MGGEAGRAGEVAVAYFRDAGYDCPAHFNAADYFMDQVSLDTRSPEQDQASQKRLDGLWARHAGAAVVHGPHRGHCRRGRARAGRYSS